MVSSLLRLGFGLHVRRLKYSRLLCLSSSIPQLQQNTYHIKSHYSPAVVTASSNDRTV